MSPIKPQIIIANVRQMIFQTLRTYIPTRLVDDGGEGVVVIMTTADGFIDD
jgi:hypothetical protein